MDVETVGVDNGEAEDEGEDEGENEEEGKGWQREEKGGLGQEWGLFNSCHPAAGSPALEYAAVKAGVVVAELQR